MEGIADKYGKMETDIGEVIDCRPGDDCECMRQDRLESTAVATTTTTTTTS